MNDASHYAHTRHLVCHWTPMFNDQEGAWETQCGDAFWINDGTPEENKMSFCPYCGGALLQEKQDANNV
jgi:hypothetical protein